MAMLMRWCVTSITIILCVFPIPCVFHHTLPDPRAVYLALYFYGGRDAQLLSSWINQVNGNLMTNWPAKNKKPPRTSPSSGYNLVQIRVRIRASGPGLGVSKPKREGGRDRGQVSSTLERDYWICVHVHLRTWSRRRFRLIVQEAFPWKNRSSQRWCMMHW